MDITFADWLRDELERRGWSQSDLARKAGVHRQVINSYINHRRGKPDEDILRRVARAFGYSPETVFRAAGLLPPKPESSELTEKIVHLVNQMDDIDKADVLEYAALLRRRRAERDAVAEFVARYRSMDREQAKAAQIRLFTELGIVEPNSRRND